MEKIILGRCKIQKDGGLTIPKTARELLNIKVGDKVALEPLGNGKIRLTKA